MTVPVRATRPPLWRDIRVLRGVAQIVAVVALVALVAYLWENLQTQLQRRNIERDWDFLDQPTGFPIPYSGLRPTQPIREAFVVAARNTASAAAVGVALCTALGLLVGVARLSSNWLVRKAAALYVETFRNLPPLLIILFANNAVLLELPRIQEAIDVAGLMVISNRQMAVATPTGSDNDVLWLVLLIVVTVAATAAAWWRRQVHDRTGAPAHVLLYVWLPWLVFGVGSYFALDGPIVLSHPEVSGLSVRGGTIMNIPYAAVTLALAVYTSSHIAEIVRGSILAVPKGQGEAATALGLSSFKRLRHVVLPQAFRIAIPPTINQFLNLTKNTSLGIAVAYAELTTFAFIAIGNGQPPMQMIVIVMAIYLSFSLVISLLLNIYNRRLRLIER